MRRFSTDYQTARLDFLEAVDDAKGTVDSISHYLSGPDGEPLFVDVAWLGPSDPDAVLMMGSGTHGVEGCCGSALQLDQLRSGLGNRLPPGVALVLVHAINPWGFAWHRRVNEDNVDVNRNFLDFYDDLPENPGYWELQQDINPPTFTPEQQEATVRRVGEYSKQHGPEAMMRAVSGGQYDDPTGVQFGGRSPVWSNSVVRRIWKRRLSEVGLVVNLDLHSGLGPMGEGLIMQSSNPDERQTVLADDWWGGVLRAPDHRHQADNAYPGLLGPALSAMREPGTTVSVVLEFGTYNPLEVFLSIVGDNWVHQNGKVESQEGRAVKATVLKVFCPDNRAWEEKLRVRCAEVVSQALAGIRVELER